MKKITCFILVSLLTNLVFAQSRATYSVTFTSNWTQSTHPHSSGNLPSNAHWSKLVGATHNDNVSFITEGELASEGIERVAEQGSNTIFFNEINAEIINGNAESLIEGSSLGSAEGEINIPAIETTENFPLLTLVSMIAPSPDWMIMSNNIELLDTNGDWKSSIFLDLYPFDAGTDSGADYTSANSDTNPPQNIASAQGVVPFSTQPIGNLTINLENIVLGTNSNNQVPSVSVYPNPASDKIKISGNNIIRFQSADLYNLLGTKVIALAGNAQTNLEMDISALPNGVYILQTRDVFNNSSSKKIIKY